MKRFIGGFFGAILGFFVFLLVQSQYSNYVAASQTSGWLGTIEPYVEQVSKRIHANRSVRDVGLGMPPPRLSDYPPDVAIIGQDGTIVLQGGSAGQTVVLIPSYADGKVSWRCVGGSRRHVLGCARWTRVFEPGSAGVAR